MLEPQGHLLVVAEAELFDRPNTIRRQRWFETDGAGFQHPQGDGHDNVRAFLDKVLRPTNAHAGCRALDDIHLDTQPDVESGCHRVDQRTAAAGWKVTEEVAVVLDLVPQPAQRLALGQVRGVGFCHRPQGLSRSPGRARPKSRSEHEGVDPLGRRRVLAEALAQPVQSAREPLELHGKTLSYLGGRQPATFRTVVTTEPGKGLPAVQGMAASLAKTRNGLPTGLWIHDAPMSTGAPARSIVCRRPPSRLRASSTTQSIRRCANAAAAVNPAIPAPTTITRSIGRVIPAGTSRPPSSYSTGSSAICSGLVMATTMATFRCGTVLPVQLLRG
jgi:hypothetical protein